LATTGSVGRKVPSVAFRPVRPSGKSIAGEQVPKSLEETEAVVLVEVEEEVETEEAAVVVVDALETATQELWGVEVRGVVRRIVGICILMF
jgi:hypothetical protein